MKTKRYIFIIGLAFFLFLLFKNSIQLNAASFRLENLSILEYEKLNDVVSRKLNLTEFDYEIISGYDSNNRYILVEGKNCYLIYDRELSDYTEFSSDTNSIYFDLDSTDKKYYLGPTYYFSYNNNNFRDLFYNVKISTKEFEEYKEFEDALEETYTLNKQIMSREINAFSTMSTNSDSSVFIPHSYYYEKLTTHIGTNTAENYTGSCAYVALEMLLTYYDTVVNDKVIDEENDVPEEEFVNSYESLNTSLFWDSPGIDNSFHEALINYGRELGLTNEDNLTYSIDLTRLLKKYLDERNLKYKVHSTGLFTNKKNFCEDAIDSNQPVVISLAGVEGSKIPKKKSHAVVGYGYDDTGIYANFGWREAETSKFNINKFGIYDAYYMELNEAHVCSNNYIWKYNGCIGTICPCGTKTCNHMSKSLVEDGVFYHKNQCNACMTYTLDEHEYYESDGYYICKGCGYKTATIHQHSFRYRSTGDGFTHKTICSCGYSKIEPCIGAIAFGGTATCSKCHQIIKG